MAPRAVGFWACSRCASGHPQLGSSVGRGDRKDAVSPLSSRLAAGASADRAGAVRGPLAWESRTAPARGMGRLSSGPEGRRSRRAAALCAMWLAHCPLVSDPMTAAAARTGRRRHAFCVSSTIRSRCRRRTQSVLVLEGLFFSTGATALRWTCGYWASWSPRGCWCSGTYRPVDTMLRAHPLRRTCRRCLAGAGWSPPGVPPLADVAAYVPDLLRAGGAVCRRCHRVPMQCAFGDVVELGADGPIANVSDSVRCVRARRPRWQGCQRGWAILGGELRARTPVLEVVEVAVSWASVWGCGRRHDSRIPQRRADLLTRWPRNTTHRYRGVMAFPY